MLFLFQLGFPSLNSHTAGADIATDHTNPLPNEKSLSKLHHSGRGKNQSLHTVDAAQVFVSSATITGSDTFVPSSVIARSDTAAACHIYMMSIPTAHAIICGKRSAFGSLEKRFMSGICIYRVNQRMIKTNHTKIQYIYVYTDVNL